MTYIVGGIVFLIVALALYKTIKQAKAGGCAGCSDSPSCSPSDCSDCPSSKH